jgi:molybdenum cofactor synthesis domain-containing protein
MMHMTDVPVAQRIVLEHARPLSTEQVRLENALFRTLARPVVCDADYPPFDRSLMDGYAVRAADVAVAPVTLKLAGKVAAGSTADRALAPGETMQISTGAPIPDGADAVVRLEETEPRNDGQNVLICTPVPPGHFITRRGACVHAGQETIRVGTRLGPLELAAAAGAGAAEVTVYRRPSVALIATGDELIPYEQRPRGAQIRNSNLPMLQALVRESSAELKSSKTARDDRTAIRNALNSARPFDIVCLTGGVSVGEFDFVPAVMEEMGATVHVRKMMIKPGRPVQFATWPGGTMIFALPGNPVSAFVGFELLVRPAIAALQGRPSTAPRDFTAVLAGTIGKTENRRSYRPAVATIGDDGRWTAKPLSWQGSGDPFGMVGANALIMRPPNAEAVRSGETISILLLDRP